MLEIAQQNPRPSALDNFERSGLFRFTRALALMAVLVVVIGLVLAGVTFTAMLLPLRTRVEGAEVAAAMKAKSNTGAVPSADDSADEAVLGTVALPTEVTKEFAGSQNRKVLAGWLKNLPKEARQDFIDNMRDVIAYAQANHIDTTDAINTYKALRFDAEGMNGLDRVERGITRATVIAGFLFGLVLLALFSLVLVLLAIERNTRGKVPTTD